MDRVWRTQQFPLCQEPNSIVEYQDANSFHGQSTPIYQGNPGWALFKSAAQMAHVVYEPAHPNPGCSGGGAGQGRTCCRWVFSEEEGTREGLFSSGIQLFMDTRLDPGASVGLHRHDTTEEIYYLLEGSLEVVTSDDQERSCSVLLRSGDAHAVRCGQSHYAQAGELGARFITVAAAVPKHRRCSEDVLVRRRSC